MQISVGQSNLRSVRSNYLYNLRRGFLHVLDEKNSANPPPAMKERTSSFDIKNMAFSPIKAAMDDVRATDKSKNKYVPSPMTPNAWSNGKVHPDGEGSVGSGMYEGTPGRDANSPFGKVDVATPLQNRPRRVTNTVVPQSINGESERASMGTIFDDQNLYYDSEEDECEMRKISKGARYKRINSCPDFSTVFKRLPWVLSKSATDQKAIADSIKRANSSNMSTDSFRDKDIGSQPPTIEVAMNDAAIKSSIMTVEEFHKPLSDDSSDDEDDKKKPAPRYDGKETEKSTMSSAAPSLEDIINAASKASLIVSPSNKSPVAFGEVHSGSIDGYKSALPPSIGGKYGKVISTHKENIIRRRRSSFPSLGVDKKRQKSDIHTMI